MKPTQITELLANIRKTFVSFFSILMFVALGVGIFLGINWSSPALRNAATALHDEGSFHHVQVVYPYGLTQDDMDKLSNVEGVDEIEATRLAYATYTANSDSYAFKLQTLGEQIDTPIMVEGELPKAADEIAIKRTVAANLGLSIGDTLTFEVDEATGGRPQLVNDTFKITALVENPEYISNVEQAMGFTSKGSVDGVGWVTADAFNDEAYQEGFTAVNFRSNELARMDTFSDAYKNASLELENRIKELGETLAPARYDDLHSQLQSKVDEGEAQLAEAEDKIAQGEQAIADGEQQLADGQVAYEQALAEADQKLAYAYEQLTYYESLKAEGEQALATAKQLANEADEAVASVESARSECETTYADAIAYKQKLDKQLADGKITQEEYDKELDEYGTTLNAKIQPYASLVGIEVPNVTHENYDEALADARSALDDFDNISITIDGKTVTVAQAREIVAELHKALDDAESEYNAKVQQLNDGWNQYYAGQQTRAAKIAEYEAKVAAAREQIESVRQQVEDGKIQVEQKKPELESAKQALEQMKKYSWTVLGRNYNVSTAEVTLFSNVTLRLSLSMAALFLVVGLLVSYSAVSRIVHEQVTQIGTKKALGLRSREITLSFLAYSALAVIAGAIIGVVVGTLVVETIVNHALAGHFLMGEYPVYVGIPLALAVTAVELVLVLGATWLACRNILREHAVELLKGEKPPTAKTRFYEKWSLWEKLPLFTQTIVNNCMNDKRRVFSTIVGVAGCTALIVTAITLNDDVLASYDTHYDEVYGFDTIVYVDPSVDGAINDIESKLQKQGATTAQVRMQRYSVTQPDGTLATIRAVAPASIDDFESVYHVNVTDGAAFDPTIDGVWVSQAFGEHGNGKTGDTLTLDTGDGTSFDVTINGFERFNLTYNEIVMGRDAYEHVFGTELVPNVILVNSQGHEISELESAVSGMSGYQSMVDDKSVQKHNFTAFSSVSRTVVLVYLVLATLMAIVVLLNLNVMFIEEKKRELIVLMINGFSVKDAKRYIYNDTIVLTIIGIIVGLVLGSAMGSITVMTIEPITASFVKGIAWRAVLVGTVGSAVLATVMSVISLRRIPAFSLTDINKF